MSADCGNKGKKCSGTQLSHETGVISRGDCEYGCDQMEECASWAFNGNRKDRKTKGCYLYAEGAQMERAGRYWYAGNKDC